MGILIGMDEAGYGPNLGPLVVAATTWEVRSRESGAGSQESRALRRELRYAGSTALAPPSRLGLGQVDLYALLGDCVSHKPADDRLAIADSKALYRPGLGLSALERGVHAALAAVSCPSSCWSTLVDELAADPRGERHRLPWHADFDCPLPVDTSIDELASLGARLAETCASAGVEPLAVRARLVFPAELNDLIERYGSKGAALSHVTIGLLRELLGGTLAEDEAKEPPAEPGAKHQFSESLSPVPSAQPPVFVVCDKHGGRNRYAGLLQHFFPDRWIETLVESRAESRYHWGAADERVEVAFRRGGESFLPAALASMTAKYVRELSMRAFNAFWCARVAGLRPTAGYPTDARRFKADIADAQRELRIDDHILWRNR
jgi:ribonuclease HII